MDLGLETGSEIQQKCRSRYNNDTVSRVHY